MTLCSLILTKFPPLSSEQAYALSVQAVVLPKRQEPRFAALQGRMSQYKRFVCTALPCSNGLGDVMCL
jgi:hypothetical protein